MKAEFRIATYEDEEDIINLIVKYLTAEYHYNFEYRKEEFHKVLTLQTY